VKVHFKDPQYQGEFVRRHPSCFEKLVAIGHFMRHALNVYGVCHLCTGGTGLGPELGTATPAEGLS
jgi:hypothetical protein